MEKTDTEKAIFNTPDRPLCGLTERWRVLAWFFANIPELSQKRGAAPVQNPVATPSTPKSPKRVSPSSSVPYIVRFIGRAGVSGAVGRGMIPGKIKVPDVDGGRRIPAADSSTDVSVTLLLLFSLLLLFAFVLFVPDRPSALVRDSSVTEGSGGVRRTTAGLTVASPCRDGPAFEPPGCWLAREAGRPMPEGGRRVNPVG